MTSRYKIVDAQLFFYDDHSTASIEFLTKYFISHLKNRRKKVSFRHIDIGDGLMVVAYKGPDKKISSKRLHDLGLKIIFNN